MYAIYGNIYHQYTPNVSIYTIHGQYMDPMGIYIYVYIVVEPQGFIFDLRPVPKFPATKLRHGWRYWTLTIDPYAEVLIATASPLVGG